MFSVLLPAKARQMWSSIEQIFLTVRASCSLAKALFSTARTTVSTPRTATYCNKYTIILLLLLIKTNYCFIKFNYFCSYSCGAFLDCFLRVFHLKQMTIRREHSQGAIVSSTHSYPRALSTIKIIIIRQKLDGVRKSLLYTRQTPP